MQKIVTIVALAATIILGSALVQAQVLWDPDRTAGSGYTQAKLDTLGITDAASVYVYPEDSGGEVSIKDFYNSRTSTTMLLKGNGAAYKIGNLWVTTGSIGVDPWSATQPLAKSKTVENLNLVVGSTSVAGNTFGATQTLDTVGVSGEGIVNGTATYASADGFNAPTGGYGVLVTANGTVNNATVKGGAKGSTFTNEGTIGKLSYYGGTYSGATGTIGTLTAYGDITGQQWGGVTSLKSGEGGAVTVSYSDKGFSGGFGGTFAGVDLTGFTLNVTEEAVEAFKAGAAFSLAALFGEADLTGTEGFSVSWDGKSYDFAAIAKYVGTDGTFALGNAAVPEPATLAILGLGLAGLGLVRRRRK